MNISFVVQNNLQIEWELCEQVLAVNTHKTMIIPINHIRSVSTEKPVSSCLEIRSPGIAIPGVIKAGTFYNHHIKEFWYVNKNQNYLTLELTDEPWQRVIITIDDNQDWAEQINQRLLINR
ncbi:MAG: hypothetical protein EAZ77_00990 [Nostocales cyanobacterium]|nr:MAG: hypothetical protein EAZ77_00990 [Nostocales cyanobacterium]